MLFSDIYFEVDNDDALLESIMGEDKIAVTTLFLPFLPLFPLHESVCQDGTELARFVVPWLQHVIIGLDNTQVFADLDLAASSTDFGQEDEDDDDDDSDDDESDFGDDFHDVVTMISQAVNFTPW
jgi:hypothetical protein